MGAVFLSPHYANMEVPCWAWSSPAMPGAPLLRLELPCGRLLHASPLPQNRAPLLRLKLPCCAKRSPMDAISHPPKYTNMKLPCCAWSSPAEPKAHLWTPSSSIPTAPNGAPLLGLEFPCGRHFPASSLRLELPCCALNSPEDAVFQAPHCTNIELPPVPGACLLLLELPYGHHLPASPLCQHGATCTCLQSSRPCTYSSPSRAGTCAPSPTACTCQIQDFA